MITDTCLADLEVAEDECWFKSSYSIDTGGGSCVSIAALPEQVGIRDSKRRGGRAFVVPVRAWASFVDEVRSGRLDR
ncbi:DUF397 domain-containing protein [Streptomyces sp. AV19]|uniref:DUF397 domain-containing protein n=1 Tax=Streptomyces sp. AV19 TaxID=2793068 RepID=UPI0018FE0EFF|nr:DUF397 domain-containing protein [Streptomyces sp. AV19]MBH1938281.1 DUF397 domain-containing protein [Streptomyces sp. AV19]MDG4534911.1 DUF397 domain-containing protein [Streptomyces sp. AV19]